ncbi:MAG: hypothetical protein LBQ50_01240 [Planctomycetaceae bacterium]|jgi:hypothetical protein|nr:hypothetical protein [Planctomycetaceae bacterium]
MKEQYGTTLIIVTLLFLVFSRPAVSPEPEPPLALEIDRERIRVIGTLMRIVSDEMILAADSDNIEEHLLGKAEEIFDDFARESDFPGPDRITKPLARKMVRPVTKTIIRYVDKKSQELSQEQGETE